jgi:LuxR family maltose regulon positive regulatory protein
MTTGSESLRESGALLTVELSRDDLIRPALKSALAAEDWPRAVRLVGAHWPELVDEHTGLLDEALRVIPLAAFSSDARAAAVRDIRLHTPADEVDLMLGAAALPDVSDLPGMEEVARSSRALNLLSVVAGRMIAFRVRGRMGRALRLAELVERYGRVALVHQPALLTSRLPNALLQAGITRGLADDVPGAMITLRDAYERGPDARTEFVARDAAGKMALFLAVMGDMDQAAFWLRDYEQGRRIDGWLEPRIALSADIARSLIATEALQKTTADDLLPLLDQPVNAEQGWGPGVTYARARHALAWGDRHGAATSVRRDKDRYGGWLGPGSTFGPLITMVESELLLATGRAHPALRSLKPHAEHPLAHAARSRIELALGDDDAASRYAATALNQEHSTRARLEALAVQIAVRHRRGEDVSRDATQFRETAQRAGLAVIAASIPTAEDHAVPGDTSANLLTAIVEAETVLVTAQQMRVLRGLESGLTLRQIGAQQHLSVNTMKTHARGLYRRLGVSTRDEAIARAYELGLL